MERVISAPAVFLNTYDVGQRNGVARLRNDRTLERPVRVDIARLRRSGVAGDLAPHVVELVPVITHLEENAAGKLTLNVEVPLIVRRRYSFAVVRHEFHVGSVGEA